MQQIFGSANIISIDYKNQMTVFPHKKRNWDHALIDCGAS